MTARAKFALPPALVLAVLVPMMAAHVAGATHPRPKGATPIRIRWCRRTTSARRRTAPTARRSHSLPAIRRCHLRASSRSALPMRTAPRRTRWGFIKFEVQVGAPGPPQDSNVFLTLNVTDVRCKGGTTACGNANATGGPDYVGEPTSQHHGQAHRSLQRNHGRRRHGSRRRSSISPCRSPRTARTRPTRRSAGHA